MRSPFVLAFLLALGTLCAPAVATAAEDDAPVLLKPPRVRRWRIGGFTEVRHTLVGDGSVIVPGVEFSWEARPHLRVGGSLALPFLSKPGWECYYSGYTRGSRDCTFNSFGLLPFAELHGALEFPVDPWIRAGVGTMMHVSYVDSFVLEMHEPDIQVFASAGLDINIGPVYVGGFGTIAAFVGRHGSVAGGGMHIGGRF